MKNALKNVKKRQQAIMTCMETAESIRVDDLAVLYGVSKATIRRDLRLLEDMGKLKRTHGGAHIQPVSAISKEAPEITRIRLALAKVASSYINNHDIIFINSSETAIFILNYLRDLTTTIITNNVSAIYLKKEDSTTLVLSGGEIRYPKEAMVGDIAINTISKITGSICIMGCNGIHPVHGVTTESFHEAKVNNLFMENTNGLRIIVADYRKIGARYPFRSVETTQVDILITDIFAPADILNSLEKQGIEVIQVDPLSV